MNVKLMIGLILGALVTPVRADPPEGGQAMYRLDPRPVAQTPRYIGVNVEVMQEAARANLWDWLADSGAGMVRIGHPDTSFRRTLRADQTGYEALRTRAEFELFRSGLLADPAHTIPWSHYLFAEELPWLGCPDLIIEKLNASGIKAIFSMAYAPGWFARPLLLNQMGEPANDESIDWGAAASAYEYYLACIWRYATRFGVTHFMMLNEPPGDEGTVRQVGVLARMARLALEDVRSRLKDRQTAEFLCLSGPAAYMNWEEYWPHVEAHVDFLDIHLYEPDRDLFARKLSRALSHARISDKRTILTEFNRVGGPMPIEESLFSIKPSLQAAGLLMAALTTARSGDPGIEAALFYQFQFPATHRNFKSLVYGDMNAVDWTGRDLPLRTKRSLAPAFEALQLRFPTLAYSMFKMAVRCTPGIRGDRSSFEVFELGEGNRGVGAVGDKVNRRNVYPALELNKYYANGGGGTQVRTLAVRARDRLIILVANPEPVTLRNVGFDVSALAMRAASVVVRETSLIRRDEPVGQLPVQNGRVAVDLPPESLIQLIFIAEDLAQVRELKIEETTVTPGDLQGLRELETTRLRALGRIGERWLDLTELNVVWSSSDPTAVKVHSTGLVQCVRSGGERVTLKAATLNGVAVSPTVNLR
jgi:hypothetical protein